MPAFHYWFTGAALWVAGSFAISTVLTVIGTKEMMSRKLAVLLVGMAILVWFIGWWTAAGQEAKSDLLQTTLNEIKAAVVLPDTTVEVQNLSKTSNVQLRKRVADLAARMRAFQENVDQERAQDMSRGASAKATQEDRQKNWDEMVTRALTHNADNQSKFRSQLLPEALALREALCYRLGILPPYQHSPRTVALDYGMLAGVAPAADAADYLESLARRLPE